MTFEDVINAIRGTGATVIINNLHIGDVYQAANMQVGSENVMDARRELPARREAWITGGGVGYQYSHCAPLDPAMCTHAEEPFEPDWEARRRAGNIYNG